MINRLKWAAGGALAAALLIAGSSAYLSGKRAQEADLRQREAQARAEAEELRAHNAALAAEAKRLETERRELTRVVDRLNVESRVALVDVIQQHTDLAGRVVQTILRLTELDRTGEPLTPRIIGVPSNVPHFDALVIKFDKAHVARGDALRGKSLALFRRVYGDNQAPEDGYWFSTPGEIPSVYSDPDIVTDFERQLWRDFWSYATDPSSAREAGVRVAQGEAVYAPMAPGEQWTLSLDASGGLNLVKMDQTSPPAGNRMTADAKLHAPPPIPSANDG